MSPMYFLVSFNINPQHLDVFYCLKNKKIMFNLTPLVFPTFLLLLIVILLFFVDILIFFFFPIIYHHWCCLSVFLLLTKLRSILNQNIASI